MIPIFAKGFGLIVIMYPYFVLTAAAALIIPHNSYHLVAINIIVSTAKKIFKRVITAVGGNAIVGETIKRKYYVTSALMYAKQLKH